MCPELSICRRCLVISQHVYILYLPSRFESKQKFESVFVCSSWSSSATITARNIHAMKKMNTLNFICIVALRLRDNQLDRSFYSYERKYKTSYAVLYS